MNKKHHFSLVKMKQAKDIAAQYKIFIELSVITQSKNTSANFAPLLLHFTWKIVKFMVLKESNTQKKKEICNLKIITNSKKSPLSSMLIMNAFKKQPLPQTNLQKVHYHLPSDFAYLLVSTREDVPSRDRSKQGSKHGTFLHRKLQEVKHLRVSQEHLRLLAEAEIFFKLCSTFKVLGSGVY